MQTILLDMPTTNTDDLQYRQAAIRECIAYNEHGALTEVASDGREVCFNCGGTL